MTRDLLGREIPEVKVYIDTLRGYYKAVAELNNVARSYGSEVQQTAHKHMTMLDYEIKARIADWNETISDDPRIIECVGAQDRWDRDCEIYYAAGDAGDDDGRCRKCRYSHPRWDGL